MRLPSCIKMVLLSSHLPACLPGSAVKAFLQGVRCDDCFQMTCAVHSAAEVRTVPPHHCKGSTLLPYLLLKAGVRVQGQKKEARQYLKRLLQMGSGTGVLTAAVILLGRGWLPQLFSPDPHVIAAAARALPIVAASMVCLLCSPSRPPTGLKSSGVWEKEGSALPKMTTAR